MSIFRKTIVGCTQRDMTRRLSRVILMLPIPQILPSIHRKSNVVLVLGYWEINI